MAVEIMDISKIHLHNETFLTPRFMSITTNKTISFNVCYLRQRLPFSYIEKVDTYLINSRYATEGNGKYPLFPNMAIPLNNNFILSHCLNFQDQEVEE